MWQRHCGLPFPSTTRKQWPNSQNMSESRCQTRYPTRALELKLEAHGLGRSLLFMLRDDDMGFNSLPQRVRPESQPNPFDVVRERLAAVGSAIWDLHPQVHLLSDYSSSCKLDKKFVVALGMGTKLFHTCNV